MSNCLEIIEACAVCAWLVAPFVACAFELVQDGKDGRRAE